MKCLLDAFWFIPMLTCLGIAGYLVATGKDGWGWFLFAALLLGPSFESSNKSNQDVK